MESNSENSFAKTALTGANFMKHSSLLVEEFAEHFHCLACFDFHDPETEDLY